MAQAAPPACNRTINALAPTQRAQRRRSPSRTSDASMRLRAPGSGRAWCGRCRGRSGRSTWCGGRGRSAFHAFEADERDLEISGAAQQVHDAHQLAVGNRLVGAQEDALVAIGLGMRVERGGKLAALDIVVAD